MSSTYLFYDVMGYPTPFQKEFFAYEEPVTTMHPPAPVPFSWAKPGGPMEEYVKHINKLSWLWKSLPFVEAIYVANSMTFNALHDESDIDLFIITSPQRMWIARACSNTILFMLGLKRRRKWIKKKFCLSFYVSVDALDIHHIKQVPIDPYLVYWLAHLVPIYHRREQAPLDVYKENRWLREYLPGFPMEHVIQLGADITYDANKFKKTIEKIFSSWLGVLVERVIKILWLPVLLAKKRRLGKRGEEIIISDTMLKFHADARREISMKRKVAKKER